MKKKKMSNSIQYRLPIWRTMLLRDEGVNYKEMFVACKKYFEDAEDAMETLRRDKKIILNLLDKNNCAEIIEKNKRDKRFWLSNDVDLLRLRQEKYYGSEQVALTGMLEQMKGILPESVIKEVTRSIRKLKREQEEKQEKTIVAYEYNIGVNQDMKFFYPIYKAIRERKALKVVKHKLNDETCIEETIFYPEFLRQYNTLWYAFGRECDEQGNTMASPCSRISLHLITSVKELPVRKYPFRPSGVDDYLGEYFSEIIGVDNIATAEVMDIRLAVKSSIIARQENNPIHESLTSLKNETCP
ncbi:MAG: hypothetical protein MJZ41_14545, partial [Bacteroidaceae bacterium]|nr:hypothetical protein [Bacteroidaceae bacterium]